MQWQIRENENCNFFFSQILFWLLYILEDMCMHLVWFFFLHAFSRIRQKYIMSWIWWHVFPFQIWKWKKEQKLFNKNTCISCKPFFFFHSLVCIIFGFVASFLFRSAPSTIPRFHINNFISVFFSSHFHFTNLHYSHEFTVCMCSVCDWLKFHILVQANLFFNNEY